MLGSGMVAQAQDTCDMDSYVEVDGRPIGFFTSILVCWAWLKAKIFGFGFFFFF